MFRPDRVIAQSPPFTNMAEVQAANAALGEAVNAADAEVKAEERALAEEQYRIAEEVRAASPEHAERTVAQIDARLADRGAPLRRRIARVRRQIAAFEWRVVATGAVLGSSDQRILAQSLLDYWSLRQAEWRSRAIAVPAWRGRVTNLADRSPSPKTLAEFDSDSAPELPDDCNPFPAILPQARGDTGAETIESALTDKSALDLRDRIAFAAGQAGLQISAEAINGVLRQVSLYPEPLALARWSFDWLWRHRDRNRISDATVAELGDPAQKMAAVAEAVFAELPDDDHRALAPRLLGTMVGQVRDVYVRRSVETERLAEVGEPGQVEAVRCAFEQRGLLVRLPAEGTGSERIVLAHDALVLHWQRLRGWLAERASDERGSALVHAAALAWQLSRSDDDLPTGETLERARQFAAEDPLIAEYVAAGDDYEQRRKTRAIRVRGIVSGLFVVALLLVGLLPVLFASDESDAGGEQAEPAVSQEAVEDAELAELIESERAAAAPAAEEADIETPRDPEAAPGFVGWVWIGSEKEPQLAREQGGPLPPSSLRPGERAVLRFDMRLRAASPTRENASGRPIGIGSAGFLVVALAEDAAIKRESGLQYWRQVKIVPRVFYQAPGSQRDAAERLRTHLQAGGFDMPGIEQREDSARMHEIRYYFEQDRLPAEQLAQVLNALIEPRSAAETVEVRRIRDKSLVLRVSPGTLELWLGNLTERAARGVR